LKGEQSVARDHELVASHSACRRLSSEIFAGRLLDRGGAFPVLAFVRCRAASSDSGIAIDAMVRECFSTTATAWEPRTTHLDSWRISMCNAFILVELSLRPTTVSPRGVLADLRTVGLEADADAGAVDGWGKVPWLNGNIVSHTRSCPRRSGSAVRLLRVHFTMPPPCWLAGSCFAQNKAADWFHASACCRHLLPARKIPWLLLARDNAHTSHSTYREVYLPKHRWRLAVITTKRSTLISPCSRRRTSSHFGCRAPPPTARQGMGLTACSAPLPAP